MSNTFTPQVGLGVVGGNVPVFLDPKCSQRAQITDLNGNALRGNALTVPEGGVPPSFQCAASTTVYFKCANSAVVSLTSGGASGVTKGDGTALPTVVLQVVGL